MIHFFSACTDLASFFCGQYFTINHNMAYYAAGAYPPISLPTADLASLLRTMMRLRDDGHDGVGQVGRDVLRIIIATPIDVVFIRAALDRAGLLVRDNYDESLPNMPVVSPFQPSSFILLGIIIHQNTNVIRKKLRCKRCGRKQRIQTVRLTTPTEVSTGWW